MQPRPSFATSDMHAELPSVLRSDDTEASYATRSSADEHPEDGAVHRGHLSIRRVADDREVAFLPGFGVRIVATRFSPDSRYLAANYEWGGQCQNYVWD